MTNRIGQRLGNYRLTRLLGRGGFAEVYLGEHIFLKTPAAIKVLNMQLTKDGLEGFLNEARTIANLVHPHIVRVLEFGVEGSNIDPDKADFDAEAALPISSWTMPQTETYVRGIPEVLNCLWIRLSPM